MCLYFFPASPPPSDSSILSYSFPCIVSRPPLLLSFPLTSALVFALLPRLSRFSRIAASTPDPVLSYLIPSIVFNVSVLYNLLPPPSFVYTPPFPSVTSVLPSDISLHLLFPPILSNPLYRIQTFLLGLTFYLRPLCLRSPRPSCVFRTSKPFDSFTALAPVQTYFPSLACINCLSTLCTVPQ